MADWDDNIDYKEVDANYFLKGLKNFWFLLEDKKKSMIFVVFGTAVTQALALVITFIMKLLFDYLPNDVENKSFSNYLIGLIIAMFLVKLFNNFFWIFVKDTIFVKAAIILENGWPVMAQKKLLELSFGYHEKENTGKKVSKINKGCEKLIELTCEVAWNFLPHILYILINIIIIFSLDWRLGLMFFLPFIPALYLQKRFYLRFYKQWEEWEKKKEESSGYFCQSLINVKTVQNFVQESKERSQLTRVRNEMTVLDTDINMKERYYFMAIRTILDIFSLGTIVLAINFVFQGSSVGTVVYLIVTGSVTIEALSNLFNTYSKILRKMVAVNRMKELLDEKPEIVNNEDSIFPEEYRGEFEFKNVEFVYSGKDNPVLTNFSLNFKAGEMVALVGKSGEGKTTVVRLLGRMYDIEQGEISLDGINIKELDLYWYRKLFAFVQQDVDIFDATIQENISYPYPQASENQVIEALKAGHLYESLMDENRFPDGLKTEVGERGIRLSGGEKQRVGIARAYLSLLNGAKILVLDEATASLDSEAERAIQNMIGLLRKKMNISIVAIAHRLSTIQMADKIFVINGGRIVESGHHEKLLAKNGLYSRLVELQKLGDLRE